MTITRRDLLTSEAAAGALLLSKPMGVLAQGLGPVNQFETSRASRLFPGSWLAHADLHNHTLFSDGAGDAAAAFDSMRSAGLDATALTDHSTVSYRLPRVGVSGQQLQLARRHQRGVLGARARTS
jgi:hypothetical protein